VTAVLGLDLSLSSTGYALNEEVVGVFKPRSRGMRRLDEIHECVLDVAHAADVVVLEHFGHLQGPAVFVVELHGVVKLALWQRRTPVVSVTAPSLKRFATGRGNATKDQVLAAAIRRFGFEGDSNDAADAWILRAMGRVKYDATPIALPGGALDALARVEWPALGAEVAV
jgi:crossover junction endodeoxyribonuclease RuvC